MKFTILLFLGIAFSSMCYAATIPTEGLAVAKTSIVDGYPSHHVRTHDGEAAQDPFLVTGVVIGPPDTNPIAIRTEVRDLQSKYPDVWNLYILALREFQSMNETDPLSYYQIAGIHGRPFAAWQGAEGIPGKSAGYCPHSNIMFLTWHRAYLALYEQLLYSHVQSVARKFLPSLQRRYWRAAQYFRIPYWDWAILRGSEDSLPDSLAQPLIQVLDFEGQLKMIENPLHHFKFHPCSARPGDFDGQWDRMDQTLRWPSSADDNAHSQDSQVVAAFNDRNRAVHDDTSRSLAASSGLNDFSRNNIEYVHNAIHLIAGGTPPDVPFPGHMNPLDYAAFDPIFMLHHANVDRLFAIWQAVHPNEYITPETSGNSGTFTIPDQTMLDANTPLSPFWKTPTSFWTSNDLRDTTTLAYAYPETQSWKFESDTAYQESVNASIASLYSLSARSKLSQATAEGDSGAGNDAGLLNANGTFNDWQVNITAQHHALDTSFVVRFSLIGDFATDTSAEVGLWSVLMANTSYRGKVGIPMPAQNVSGAISLTASLVDSIDKGELSCLDAERVVPYLKSRLSWEIIATNGTRIPNDRVPSLQIMVENTQVQIPLSSSEPLIYNGRYTSYPEITAGKAGGVAA